MNVLLVGNGGREHAIAWKLSKSKNLSKLFIAPGNPGTAKCGINIDIQTNEYDKLIRFAKDNNVGLAVIGPEDPLSDGIVDMFEKAGIKAFGPSGAAAQIEADKAFAKKIMKANSVPTAESKTFEVFSEAKAYIASRDEAVVIKAAGLAKGKGVYVCDEPSDGINAAEKMMCDKIFGKAGATILVEDKLLGQEASILALVDSKNIYVLETAQDHKAIGDGDTGPNTGGMGAYSPAPVVTEKIMEQIIREILVPTVDGMNRNGTPYKGVLYAGVMITQGGPRTLEFNARFGDPETQPILARLKSDLLEAMLATCDGTLDKITLEWDERPAVCVVMASGGYPGDYEKGKVITGVDEAEKLGDVNVFHAGTEAKDGKVVSSGGRVLGVTALGKTIADAQAKAYQAVEKINFEKAYYRKDIADKAIKKNQR
ncbi:MAG TPA: phosphoribosylamine--glycine ligase [Phycisphaerales bacterium]|nr:MAG: phosphoribosylamine--glycine ligase [Planctomycetes bacterium GWC2_45_44]HBG77720.1 phosphoribosylamine--glycine ligase [Phycisphaerales bacterium]HBR20420.1 phosphoribosylamine--glycine ligase [Phycisphaerales bacterium]